jgi:hypothetical protein
MALDTVPVNKATKDRIKQLQVDVAVIKGIPKISQQDLMEIMTKEYQELIKK